MLTAVMVPYGNEDAGLTRLERDLLPALKLIEGETEVIVIDNSPLPLARLADAVRDNGLCPGRYYWQDGRNLLYGPGLNLAVSLARNPYLLYVCANHGESFDPTWAEDLITPLADPDVAMTGCLRPAGPPDAQGFPASLPDYHVQGGVFAARTAALVENPYPDGEYAHWGADIYGCFQLMATGWQLVDVPSVRSVWRDDPGDGCWKYLHRGGI